MILRRLMVRGAMVFGGLLVGAWTCRGDVLITTWNMKWFPSGIANLRADAAQEQATIARAGAVLAGAVADQTRRSSADLVVLAQEVRDEETMAAYARASGIDGLKVAAVSGFRDGDVPIWQQVAILTTLPIVDAGYCVWAKGSGVTIPRGFAYALLDGGEKGAIACFSVHLKSNVNASDTMFENQKNIYKREAAAAQILALTRRLQEERPGERLRVVVGGDFNTSDDDLAYVSESTLRSFLYGAHFRSCFRDWRPEQKVTHPGNGFFPDATFDYILYRGFERIASRRIYAGSPVSDHNLVALRLR